MFEKSKQDVAVNTLSVTNDESLLHVERIRDSDYVLAAHHSLDGFTYGGLVNESGVQEIQIMADGAAARFDPETLEIEYPPL